MPIWKVMAILAVVMAVAPPLFIVVASLLESTAAGLTSALDCTDWNTEAYFEIATAESVMECVDAGVDLNARNGRMVMTPLHVAASVNDDPAIITALLDAGADLGARNAIGLTPLHYAASNNDNPAIITTLLDAGADLGAQGSEGLTPLHLAASNNDDPAIVTALLDAGADLNAGDAIGRTPWDMAQVNDELRDTDAYWRLSDGRAAPPTPTSRAAPSTASGPSSLSSEAAPTAVTSESPSTDADRLLQADIGVWRQATSTDQLLAASALAYVVLESLGELEAVGGADGLRPYADDLVYCISDGTAMDGEAIERLEVREIAAMCIVQMGDAWGGSR